MKIKSFEEIKSWQLAKDLTLSVYKLFKDNKDFGFKDQIQRASVSVMNNIAEGFERQTDKEFINFLYIAKGSAGEVRSMLHLSKELNYISDDNFKNLSNSYLQVSRLLHALINSIKTNTNNQ